MILNGFPSKAPTSVIQVFIGPGDPSMCEVTKVCNDAIVDIDAIFRKVH